MSDKCFFFAGGGTGGHIYPALAIAERILQIKPDAKVRFFCSNLSIDLRIFSKTDFVHASLPVRRPSISPSGLINFGISFVESYKIAKQAFENNKDAVVIGIGGFVSMPVCLAAHKLNVPIVLLNVDIVPGRANKIIAKWANQIFVQFEDSKRYFGTTSFRRKREGGAANVAVVGCPLRSGFDSPQPERMIQQLGLDEDKKILLVTGASSGSQNINEAVCSLLENLAGFAEQWQIVHLTGRVHFEKVQKRYTGAQIRRKVVDYLDKMPDLLSAADLVIGRSGAVSVAEYAAAGVPSICIPYPYHWDKHQYLNAKKLVDAGAAVIVKDSRKHGNPEMAQRLWAALEELMRDDEKRKKMAECCKAAANKQAASQIAETLLKS